MAAGWGAFEKPSGTNVGKRRIAFAAILGLTGAVAIACLIIAGAHHGWLVAAASAASLAVFLTSALLLRHAGLALVVAASPLPAFAVSLLGVPSGSMAVALALPVAFVTAMVTASVVVARYLGEEPERGPAPFNFPAISVPVGASILLPAAASFGGFAEAESTMSWQHGLYLIGGMVAAALLVLLGGAFLNFDEDFVARCNRWQEWQARSLSVLLAVARPRFGLSVAGIACVLSAIAFFGEGLRSVALTVWLPLGTGVLAAVLVCHLVLHDWRRSVACLLSLIPVMLISFLPPNSGPSSAGAIPFAALSAITASVIFQLVMLVKPAKAIQTSDELSVALESAIETRAVVVCAACAAGFLSSLALLWKHAGATLCFDVTVLAGAVSAILVQPAITVAIDHLMPRSGTLQTRYRVR